MKKLFIFILLISNISFAAESSIWSFVGRVSPDHWSKLDKKFESCGEAEAKGITEVTENDLDINATPIIFDYNIYKYDPKTIEASKHMNIGGRIYKLIEFHIHLPSEHSINGNIAKAAIHFIHQDKDNNIAVVAVMIKEGKSNPTIKNLIATVYKDDKEKFAVEDGDLSSLLPVNKEYYHQIGSMSTPPCTDKVNWYIMKDAIEATSEEITNLNKTIVEE
jgi:carbonic anhydrase